MNALGPSGSAEPALAIGDDRTRVVFTWRVDRYAHAVQFRAADGAWMTALTSIEGTADEPWPASPPLQQAHREDRPAAEVILAVGMAGRSHWSASIAYDAAACAIDFDLACRVFDEPAWLGSSYEGSAAPLTLVEGRLLRGDNVALARLAPIDCPGTLPRTVRWRYRVVRPAASPADP